MLSFASGASVAVHAGEEGSNYACGLKRSGVLSGSQDQL